MHLTPQQLRILAAQPIIEDSAEAKHLKNCRECMDAVRRFASERNREIQNRDEADALFLVLHD